MNSTTMISLHRSDIPILNVSGDPAVLDFRRLGLRAAEACYRGGRSFSISIIDNPDGLDVAGRPAGYDLIVKTSPPSEERRLPNWTTLGVVDDALYQTILPPYFWAENPEADLSVAMAWAERNAATLRELKGHLDTMMAASQGRDDIAPAQIIAAAAAWGRSGFWMAYDASGMYALDNRHKGAVNRPEGHKIYPDIDIIAGTFRNSMATAPGDITYLADCLNDVARMEPSCGGEEYLVADASIHLQLLSQKQPCAFLHTALTAHGAPAQDIERFRPVTPTPEELMAPAP